MTAHDLSTLHHALPADQIIQFSRMNAVLEFDAEGRRLVVQPGAVNQAIDALVKHHGLYYPPDPSSGRAATIGGNIAENSGGPHCAISCWQPQWH